MEILTGIVLFLVALVTLILVILRIRANRRFLKALKNYGESQDRLSAKLTELEEVLTKVQDNGETLIDKLKRMCKDDGSVCDRGK